MCRCRRGQLPVNATLCYLRRGRELLLVEKSKGLGQGYLNGPGGKIEAGESLRAAVVREVREETGVELRHVEYHGRLHFYFGQRDGADWIVHVFSSREFIGRPRERDTGRVLWVREDAIPYERMWPDDRFWLPHLLAGRAFEGHFYFTRDMQRLLDHRLQVLTTPLAEPSAI